jgi:hypothetical protein
MIFKNVEDTINIRQLTPYLDLLTTFLMGENAVWVILRSGDQTRIE